MPINDPMRQGSRASHQLAFGKWSRYRVGALHTRFDRVTWFVWDAEKLDENGQPDVIRQADTLAEAVAGLEAPDEYVIEAETRD